MASRLKENSDVSNRWPAARLDMVPLFYADKHVDLPRPPGHAAGPWLDRLGKGGGKR